MSDTPMPVSAFHKVKALFTLATIVADFRN